MNDLSRVEQLLRNALGEDIYEVTPQSRVEVLLQELNELIEGLDTSVSPEDIATAVSAYLDEHLTTPTSPPVDTSLAIAGAAADAKKTGNEISELKEGLLGRIALDTSDRVSAYASSTIGSVVTFTSSSATYTLKKALAVEEGKQYQVSVKNGVSLSSSNARSCVITDDTDIVRQVISLQSVANETCIIRFTAECDGWLYLCVDKQYVDIWAEGGTVYENTLVVNNDNAPNLTLGIKATVGLNYYINGGKITKKTNNTARASSELFYIPDKYNYMMIEANAGYAVNMHRVNPFDNTATTVMWWARGTLILPVEHDMEYVVQGAMRNTTSTVVLPQDGTIAKLYLFRDLPNQWLCPMYSYDKQPQLDLIYYEAGNLSPQGIATDGKNIIMCVPKGRMSLIDIKTRTVIKTITFSDDQYGHMNSVTYYNSNYYVPNMKATGEVYVFDAETLDLVDTIIPLDENGQPYAVWRFSYDKSTNRFYSAHTTVTQELYLIYDTSFNLVDTVQLFGSTTIDGSAQTYRQAMLVDKDYIYELNTSHDFAYNFIVIHKKTGEFVGIVQVDEITGHEMEGIAYDWDHDIMYISYTNRQTDPYDRGFALMRMNLKSQPNIEKVLSYVADVLQ